MSEKTVKRAARPKKTDVPEEVVLLAKEVGEDVGSLLGWQVYADKVVIIGGNGQKFSKVINDGG